MTGVLDASAVLALLADEPGAEQVAAALEEGAAINAVNDSEVLAKLLERDVPIGLAATSLRALGMHVEPFDVGYATVTAWLREATRHAGLSLGDRACLATALLLGLPVWTADRAWHDVDVGVTVRWVR